MTTGRSMKKIALRALAVVFLVAAILQYISYNSPQADGAESNPINLVFGWLWTCLIALPGAFLWAATIKDERR